MIMKGNSRIQQMNIVIKETAFKGLHQFNGLNATLETDRNSGLPIMGKNGTTKAFSLMGRGRVFLTPDQYIIKSIIEEL